MYLTQHWIFVISYLRVSVIFKLVFSLYDVRIQEELRNQFGDEGLNFSSQNMFINLCALLEKI